MKTELFVIGSIYVFGIALLASVFVTRLTRPIAIPTQPQYLQTAISTAITNAWQDGYKEGQLEFHVKTEASFLRDTWKRGYMTGLAVAITNVSEQLQSGQISSRQLSELLANGLTNNPWYSVP